MSALRIARFEWKRLRLAPGILLASLLLAGVIAGGTLIPHLGLDDPPVDYGVAFLLGPGTELLLPLVAVLLSYGAIAALKERGTLSLFLGAPNRRFDVFVGVLIGRITVALTMTVVALLTAIGVIIVVYGFPSLRTVGAFILFTGFATVAYTTIGVAVSASVTNRIRAVTILVAGVFIFHTLWSGMLQLLHYLLTGSYPHSESAWWFDSLHTLSPLEAYSTTVNWVLPPSPHLFVAVDDSGIDAETGDMVGGGVTTGEATFAIAILAAWILGSFLIGLYRFNTREFS